jgi:hypothetical protein
MKCINCGHESDMSVCAILSTKGRKPRIQKSSKAVSLCGACIHNLEISGVTQVYATVLLTLRETYTALTREF